MPVSIDEVTAEVEPSPNAPSSSGNDQAAGTSPEAELRKLQDMLARVRARAARIRAD